jgi:serine/threonine protein kinase/tetratricopeptide (TPR) repeat protein
MRYNQKRLSTPQWVYRMIETIAGRYQLNQLLGAGGMGAVYLGIDLTTQQPVAIKVIKTEIANPEMIERFRREGNALRELNHPNIVKMVAMVQHQDQPYLILEYVQGGDLTQLIGHGTLSLSQILNIALDLSDALTRAHRLGIIHRDLKPANVLIASDGTPRLTDFGIAHIETASKITSTGSALGTIDYISPEGLNGETVDARTDLWSFGILLYEMLIGKNPFKRDSVGATLTAIMRDDPPDMESLRTDIPLALVDLTYRLLTKDRNQRINSVRIVGAELENILKEVSTGGVQMMSAPAIHTAIPKQPTSAPLIRHNLPINTTPFVGRETEIAQLQHLLEQSHERLVTIVATGGMGKTRLSLEVGHMMVQSQSASITQLAFQHGVYFLPLAPLSSPDQIPTLLAEVLDCKLVSNTPQQEIITLIKNQHLLLILDNFEHLLGGAMLVSEWLQVAPHIKVIATSRERLNLQEETVFRLGGLDIPNEKDLPVALESAVVKLFVQSAKRVQADFRLQEHEIGAVVAICRQLDGLPLGVVLAAVWVEMLTVAEIRTEIERNLDFLESDSQNLPERQRSIRAVFEYSYRLVGLPEQDILQQLSVFVGKFTREAAQAVTGANLRQLNLLLNKSLIRRNVDSGLFEMHELVRQYAHEKLAQSGRVTDIADTHSRYYLQWLASLQNDLMGTRQFESLNEVEIAFENIRKAWQHATQHHHTVWLLPTFVSLDVFCLERGYQVEISALMRTSQTIYATHTDTIDRQFYKRLTVFIAQYNPMSNLANQLLADDILASARTSQDRYFTAIVLYILAMMYRRRGELEKAIAHYHESLDIMRQLELMYYVSSVLNALALCLNMSGRSNESVALLNESLQISRAHGDYGQASTAIQTLSAIAFYQGDYQIFHQRIIEALDIAIQVADYTAISFSRVNATFLPMLEGDFDKARQEIYETIPHIRLTGYDITTILAHLILAAMASIDGDVPQAIRLCEQYPAPPQRRDLVVIHQLTLAIANLTQDNHTQAQIHCENCYKTIRQLRSTAMLLWVLPIVAILRWLNQDAETATQYLSCSHHHPYTPHGFFARWQLHIATQQALRGALGERFDEVWEAGKTLDITAIAQTWQ